MTEPIYEYVKGQGWVLQIQKSRVFEWGGKRWRITAVDEIPENALSWTTYISKKNLVEISERDMMQYAREHWMHSKEPGNRDLSRRKAKYPNCLFLFTEIE